MSDCANDYAGKVSPSSPDPQSLGFPSQRKPVTIFVIIFLRVFYAKMSISINREPHFYKNGSMLHTRFFIFLKFF